ncbi:MAG TPA: GNAT family N-acetyltransferase [Candidatus Angelobacter sp.]|nr:GNAT family N-acetyltransferase [Candidatus Angelobacter sp.]
MAAGKITLRPVQESDNEFLLKVYGSTREQEMAQVPWTAEQKQQFIHMQWEAQKNHYAAQHPNATHEIISVETTDVGRLYLDRSGDNFHILDITLLPEHRNDGAGSFLLRQIMAEAKEAGKPVTIYVETFNPSLRLFQRLGFTPIQQEGFHLLLQCAG